MKVLFICSGNSKNGISPIIKNQGTSLQKCRVDIDYFPIQGKGLWGYLQNVKTLRKYYKKKKKYQIVHAHYLLS